MFTPPNRLFSRTHTPIDLLTKAGTSGRAILMVLALGLPLAPAAAQCNVSRTGTPDFDQRRLGHLPNDGRLYCVPVAVANLLALLANSGYPNAFNVQAGGNDWKSGAMFGMVSYRLNQLGYMMNTEPNEGTTLENARYGTQQWLGKYAPGQFVVQTYTASEDFTPTPQHLYGAQKLGGYVAPGWGRYVNDGVGLTRNGGHMVSMTVMWDACSTPRMTWRDPDDAGPTPDTVQSLFTSQTAFLIPTNGLYRQSAGSTHTAGVMHSFSNGINRIFDNFLVINPVKYTVPSQTPGEILVHNPIIPAGLLLPAVQQFTVPSNGVVEDVILDPLMLAYYATTRADSAGPARVWRIDAVSGLARLLHTPSAAGPLLTGRFGELYIPDGRTLSAMGILAEEPAIIASTLFPAPIDAAAYDDETDTIVAVSIGQRQLMIVDRHLVGPVHTTPIPSTVPLGGEAWIAIGRDGQIFLGSSVSNAIYQLEEDTTSTCTKSPCFKLEDVIVSSYGTRPEGLQVDDRNNLFFIDDGSIRELEKDATGTWGPAAHSTLAGMPAHRRLSIARSRTNFDAATMSGPEFHNIAPGDGPGIPDCYANCDRSEIAPVLNVDDFTCFINEFAAAQALDREAQILHYANCDGSTLAPVLNVDDFTCFINAFAQGCN